MSESPSRQRYPSHPDSAPVEYKIFNDSIHGHIAMHPLLVAVIDTPQFQRLRWIKQLGVGYLVYPGACHNRFEHSLGTAHLAGEFVRSLRKNQPELDITDVDVLCVEMAGLCHDLGHGPFSHVFDGKFMAKIGGKWKHEQASLAMFDYMLEQNPGLEGQFEKYRLTKHDILFIKELINGPVNEELEGRSKPMKFLYELISNKDTGIDVDKWDYFARDCHHLGLKSTFDAKRFIFFARVIWPDLSDGETRSGETNDRIIDGPIICCRDKEAKNIYDMFQVRANLHRTAYQHKTTHNLEHMLVAALAKANDHIKMKGKEGKMLKMSECVVDMEAYMQLTDNIFTEILQLDTDDERLEGRNELKEAQEILRNMQRRKLFKYIGETGPPEPQENENENRQMEGPDERSAQNEIAKLCAEEDVRAHPDTERTVETWKNDLLIGNVVKFNYGMKNKNPVDNMLFYSKSDPKTVFTIKKHEVSMMLPMYLEEWRFRLYCPSEDGDVHKVAIAAFGKWCAGKGYAPPRLV